ncbi:unnamed protein product [Orchesella dallaii]|uniref:C2H2-type domain-containing protein n=1 Tax=Orchesella dallaii TaxID=48710 RepID=A0ABP1PVG9_9HEXA
MQVEVKEAPVDFNDDPEQKRTRFTHPHAQTPFRLPVPLNEEVEGEGGGGGVVAAVDSELPSTSRCGGSGVVGGGPSSSGLSHAIAQVVNNTENLVAVKTEETQNHTGLFKKSTCLFCGGMLFVHVNTNQQSVKQVEQVTGLVKNLCHQMRLNDEGFPERCTDNMFPFCKGCKELLKNCLDLKKEFDQKMAEAIKRIRDKVVHGKVLDATKTKQKKPGLLKAEALKFTQFRDMILHAESIDSMSIGRLPNSNAGNNNKIAIQQNLISKHVQSDPCEPEVDNYDDGNITAPLASSHAPISEESPGPSQTAPPAPPEDNQIAGPSSADTGSHPGSKAEVIWIKMNGKKRKINCSSVPPEFLPLVVVDRLGLNNILNIKQERVDAREEEEHFDMEYDADDDVCYVVKKKRKLQYNEVEIYQWFDKNGVEFVECNSCKFNLPIENVSRGVYKARQVVKNHIRDTHAAPPPPKPKTTLSCDSCDAVLDSKVALRYHQRNHDRERHEKRIDPHVKMGKSCLEKVNQLKRKPSTFGDPPILTPQKKMNTCDAETQRTSKGKKSKVGNFWDKGGTHKARHSRKVVEENEDDTLPVLTREVG